MSISKRHLAAATSLALFVAGSAQAHHSYTMFDMEKNITLDGTVKEVQWTNPHIWIQLTVKDADGKDVEWSIEGASPNMLSRAGWTRKSLQAGDHATIVVFPVKVGNSNPHSGSLSTATVNGKRIFGGQGTTKAEDSK